MLNKALGLIETYGLIGLIAAADTCVKTANVNLIDCEYIGGGYVTIKILGDISAVKASVDAGAAAASRVGKVVSVDVIANPGIGLEKIICAPKEKGVTSEIDSPDKSTVSKEVYQAQPVKEISLDGEIINLENINNLKVTFLRRLIRSIDEIPMKGKEVDYARKNELIDIITDFLKGGE